MLGHRFNYIVYIRPTEKCNLRCKHCFIPPNPNYMTDEQLYSIPKQLSKEGITGNVLLQWHGGEPLLLNPFKAEKLINALNDNEFNINFIHGIQTNLIVLNNFSSSDKNQWYQNLANLFDAEYIGVSWDYNLRGRNFESEFARALNEIRSSELFNDEFNPYVTITAAKPFIELLNQNSFQFLEYFTNLNLTKVHIEKLTPTGYAKDNWQEIGVSNKEYSQAMISLYRAYKRYHIIGKKLHISPLDNLENAILTSQQNHICASGVCTSNMLTFNSEGIIKSCTAIAEHSNKQLHNYTLEIEAHCHSCEFNTLCNGGCPAHNNVIDNSGECSGNKTLQRFISTHHQTNNLRSNYG